ncbi:MAG: phosphatidylethanolamine N-methyltransferase family protein [bacterium]|nr:phosphatidylethanolamine N-methyltransferase family protein [bacterium]
MIWFYIFLLARGGYITYLWRVLGRKTRANISHSRFKTVASWLMNIDALVLIIAIFQSSNQIVADFPWLIRSIGVALAIFGLVIKFLAFRVLGSDGYHWRDFFLKVSQPMKPKAAGIYKYIKNPMYGFGYLPAYGWALINLSISGLIMAALAQASILTFSYFVERPHFKKIYQID